MAFLGILMAAYALLITPLRLRIDLAAGTHLSGALVLAAWGLRLQANLGLIRDASGELHLALRFKEGGRQHSGSVEEAVRRARALIRLFRRARAARAFFAKMLSIQYVGVSARVGFADAAHTALAAGAVSTLLDMARWKLTSRKIPCRLRSWPDFSGKPCAAQLTCILFMRLGNLLLAGAMAGIAAAVAKMRSSKEERAWSTPSGT